MADYKKMYTGLCAAVDDSITALEAIPAARGTMHKLQKALEDAEEYTFRRHYARMRMEQILPQDAYESRRFP